MKEDIWKNIVRLDVTFNLDENKAVRERLTMYALYKGHGSQFLPTQNFKNCFKAFLSTECFFIRNTFQQLHNWYVVKQQFNPLKACL